MISVFAFLVYLKNAFFIRTILVGEKLEIIFAESKV